MKSLKSDCGIPMTDDLHMFLNSTRRNAWLYLPDMNVYARKSQRYIQTKQGSPRRDVVCFDIANINVHSPGTGAFTRWLAELKPLLKDRSFEAIYVESVLNKRFEQHLDKIMVRIPGIDVNFVDFL